MVELVVVLLLVGVLGAIGASRFFDNAAYDNRSYADQVKTLIRYAQKLAISQNGTVFVRATPNSFALCSNRSCNDATKIAAPAGTNSGSKPTQTYCLNDAGSVSASWMCVGRPASVSVAVNPARPEFGANGVFYFDGLGRPYNTADTALGKSTFTSLTLNFNGGANNLALTINAETGYVQ